MKFFLVLAVLVLSFQSQAQNRVFKNISALQNSLGFTSHYKNNKGRPLKVAVLDKGFSGAEYEIGQSLPEKTYYVEGPVKNPEDMKTEHGFRMAQIMSILATNDMENKNTIGELYLYNVYGFTNFSSAIDDLIARQIDVVLYSEVWEYGGNHDGLGFINAQVTKATKAGVIWINAAGNFAMTTYNSSITTTDKDGWVKLPDQNNALAIRCEKSKAEKCLIKVVLSWNDFKNDIEPGTKKDLDLALTDDLLNIVQTSALRQSNDPKEERPGFSKYPREILTAEIKPGQYFLRVKNYSNNFGSKDTLRITVDGDNITMPSRSKDESLLNPADNPHVITVGASDSDRSSVSMKMNKPDIMAPSSLTLTDSGDEFRGSSNAAAIVAAGVVLMKSMYPNFSSKQQVLQKISKSYSWEQGGLSLSYLGFMPTQGGCFRAIDWKEAPDYVKQMEKMGGIIVETTAMARMMFPFDPIKLAPGIFRQFENDMIVVTPTGEIQAFPRNSMIPPNSMELFQRPIEAGLCQTPAGKMNGRSFGL